METIVFLFDVSTFRRDSNGPTTGAIWIRIAGRDFPEQGWSDFPLVIVGWWLAAVRELEAGALSRSLEFMDGSCPLMLTRREGDLFDASGWDQSRRLFSAELSLTEVGRRLRQMAEELEIASGERLAG